MDFRILWNLCGTTPDCTLKIFHKSKNSNNCHLKQEEGVSIRSVTSSKQTMKEKSDSTEKNADCTNKVDEKELEKRAVDEIFREIAIKSVRAKEFGPSGWLDCPLKKTNKRFLSKTLKATVSHNERKIEKQKFSSEKKLLEMEYDKKPSRRLKFGDRKHLFKKKPKEERKKT